MPLSWNDIKTNALAFSREWQHAASEDADAKSFWDDFFAVFGIKRRRVATFETRVKKLEGKDGYIDLLWKGKLLIEHKSRGKNLDRAHAQATGYFAGLKEYELPQFILVCDFAHFRLYDLDTGTTHEFALTDLHKNVKHFGFIAGYRKQIIREQDPINIVAVQKMGVLHDALRRDNYAGHALEVFLVRLMFCLFAEDTGIFPPGETFRELIENFTNEDGGNVDGVLDRLFNTLDTDFPERQASLPEQFAQFPYVNGLLFRERLAAPAFNRAMRESLLSLTSLNWGAISPAIFGAMFQKVIELDEKDRRRQLGAHYTSEENIQKLIGPLFLDELREELAAVKGNANKLFEFLKKLGKLTFLDPACGCGNFLVITYRELRKLELDALRAAEAFGQRAASVFTMLKVDVDQFYGIEVEEFPAQVAQVAMWLVDHQMNIEASEVFGLPILRIPLEKSAKIRLGNALRIDWAEFVPPTQLNYILGNPPFVGKQYQTAEQKEDLKFVTAGIKGAGVLDYVAGWYIKAAQYCTAEADGFGHVVARASRDRKTHKDVKFGKGEAAIADMFMDAAEVEVAARHAVRCAFVSTNSITQGEQVGVLWSYLLSQGMQIHFAHRTFQWMNEAPGKAAVHCVIIGFAAYAPKKKRLFEYADIKGAPHELVVENVNPYLVDAPDIVLEPRRQPIRPVLPIVFGNMPNDGGHLLMSEQEMHELISIEPQAEKWIYRFVSADEFISNRPRYCLWLVDCGAEELRRMPEVRKRVEAVREHRRSSVREATQALAATPTLFGERRQPKGRYVVVPRHSSERRHFVPVGFLDETTIVGDSNLCIPDATRYEFGVFGSTMHNAWIRHVCGRLESRFRYSAGIVYNNFPWPEQRTEAHRQQIESAAQSVLDVRATEFARDPATSLATLYDPDTMPPALVKAHRQLDAAVDAAYVPDGGKRKWANDAERVAFLFKRYAELTSLV